MLFRLRSTGNYEYIIAGLGNPGSKYELSRHNAGFLFTGLLEDKLGIKLTRLKFHALCGDAVINGHRCLVMRPQTYMNNSGEAVGAAASFYKIAPERVVVVYDDISLTPGKLRVRRRGSDGGHNGIKSIIAHLGSSEFPRIKLGVGAKPNPEYDLADWVLSRFTDDELKLLRQASDKAFDALPFILDGKIEEAMNRCNG